MANIGEPLRRHHVVPLDNPVSAPAGPVRPDVTEPEKMPEQPVKVPDLEPVP